MFTSELISALLFQSGYNAAVVTVGATILGTTAGAAGGFLFLRKRALVSDAMAHATLPGIALAFLLMVALGGDGRSLIGLLIGAAATAALGFILVEQMSNRTRLTEDAAIGAVLSVLFGFGVVLMTVIQSMSSGRQAGLEDFLLGSTASIILSDAILLSISAAIILATVVVFRRPFTLVCFDPEFAAASGYNVRQLDLLMLAIIMAVTVIGLKIVGLVLIIALLIIPPVAARFWSEQTHNVIAIGGGVGGIAGYLGAALSASHDSLPTGPIIVLVSFAVFVVSFLFAPSRGIAMAAYRQASMQKRLRLRSALLAAHRRATPQQPTDLPPPDLTPDLAPHDQRLLIKAKLIAPTGQLTELGKAQTNALLRNDRRWQLLHQQSGNPLLRFDDGDTQLSELLPADELALLDASLDKAANDENAAQKQVGSAPTTLAGQT